MVKGVLAALVLSFGVVASTNVYADAASESLAAAQSTGLSARSLRKMARGWNVARAGGNFKNVCASVRSVSGSEFLYKSDISHHISPGDARAAGPTLICNRVCPATFPANLYFSDGTLAAKLGYYGRWNLTGKPRAYCAAGGAPACSNSTIARNSRASGRDGNVYLQVSRSKTGSGTVCYRVRPLGRTGSPT
jgi:hypothetical protein